ncbi:MAG: hypothetical protein JRN10_02230 [Nitrososphaerota archaeon]|jgi:hypothetical protein|nr:hypothetical protein [Nitrososphaerota archaeon]
MVEENFSGPASQDPNDTSKISLKRQDKLVKILRNNITVDALRFSNDIDKMKQDLKGSLEKLGAAPEEIQFALTQLVNIIETAENERQNTFVSPFWKDETHIYEAVTTKDGPRFLTYERGMFSLLDSVKSPTKIIKPVEIQNHPYAFESIPVEVPNLKELYERVYNFVDDYWFHTDKRLITFNALYILSTYVLPKAPGTFFEFLVGAIRTGKDTLELLFEMLAYRSLAGVSDSEASIYRSLGSLIEYAPTIVLKEKERSSQLGNVLLREGDIHGAVTRKVDKQPDGTQIPVPYFLFGARIYGANKIPPEFTEADIDRFFVAHTVRGKPKQPRTKLELDPETLKELNGLRNDLLLWRVLSLPSFEIPYEDPKKELDGRDWEHYGAILTLAGMVGVEVEIRKLIREYVKEQQEQNQNSPTVLVARAILELAKATEGDACHVPSEDIWNYLSAFCLPFKTNEGQTDDSRLVTQNGQVISRHMVGKLIKEQLGGKSVVYREKEKTVRGFGFTKEQMAFVRALVTDVTDVTLFSDPKSAKNDHNQTPMNSDSQKDPESDPMHNNCNKCNIDGMQNTPIDGNACNGSGFEIDQTQNMKQNFRPAIFIHETSKKSTTAKQNLGIVKDIHIRYSRV